jgi:Mrp family chromosome partitioning ATPase
VKVLAEIAARSSPQLRLGSLRRSDLEAYGGLLGQLDGARSVIVTGDGSRKRYVAAGLAATAAALGSRTALVECDLTDPGLADALGLANAPGLHEYLCGAAEVEAVLKPVVLAGPGAAEATEPLVCIVAGRSTRDSWAMLASDRFRQAVADLRSAYELVVLDGPSFEDQQALGTALGLADASLACVAARESSRRPPVPVSGLVALH